jgi:hypothetical protein
MTKQKLEADLGYIKDLVSEADRRPSARGLYLLWAVIILIGFSLVDLAPEYTGWFWMVAGPVGGILSGIIGHRYSLARGQLNRTDGIRHALHWSGMLMAVGFTVLLAVRSGMSGTDLSRMILIVITFGWWCAGVHFDRAFLTLGAIMGLGFLATMFIAKYVWLGLAIVLAAELVRLAIKAGGVDASQKS